MWTCRRPRDLQLASHASVFKGLELPPPPPPLWGGGNTRPLKTPACEATRDQDTYHLG